MNNRILKDITDYIFVSDDIVRSDVIFLPGGAHSEVPEHGAKLFLSGAAPLLIPSGKYAIGTDRFSGAVTKADKYGKSYETECEFYTDVLKTCGVPTDAVIGEDKAQFTYQNALFSSALCEEKGIKVESAVICCKAFHARRCLMYYGMCFPDARLYVSPVDCCGVSRDNWYKSKEGYDIVMGEMGKCADQLKGDLARHLMLPQ